MTDKKPDRNDLPFGAGAVEETSPQARAKGRTSRRRPARAKDQRAEAKGDAPTAVAEAAAARPPAKAAEAPAAAPPSTDGQPSRKRRRWQDRRRRKRRDRRPDGGETREQGGRDGSAKAEALETSEGMLVMDKAQHGQLRSREKQFLASKQDPHVAPRLLQKYALREGSILRGPVRKGSGRHKWELVDVETVDGRKPNEVRDLTPFKKLTSIDPDFHYAVGDESGEVAMKVIDVLCPVGRGQRGLIVAPPRSGKTILLQQFAKGIESIYPEVHLIVLLVDERPEEATEWRRLVEHGDVFVSTNDELHKNHVALCEVVWRRCRRLVELGEDVVLLLDSITRMGRAYNNVLGNSGKTMSGGIDTRALERPKQFFGSARNTETAGSLTILATTLIETGSRMDQVIFEEFKGTGNMELVLSRRLADRRIFPAIDLVKSGTRKEEKIHSSRRLKWCTTLRRVLTRMHFAEAMELLVTKLDDVEKIDDFLKRFEVDPEE